MDVFSAALLLFGACDQVVELYDRQAIVKHFENSSNPRGGNWKPCCTWRHWGRWPERKYLGTSIYWYVPNQSHDGDNCLHWGRFGADEYESLQLKYEGLSSFLVSEL